LLVAGLLVVVVTSACVVLGSPQWMVNDDAVMAAMSSGSYTGSPETLLVYVSRILGSLLALLYGVAPGLPWYALALLATLGLALVALSSLARTWSALLAWGAISLPILTLATLRPSFTTVAVVSASSGAVIFIQGLKSGNSRSLLSVGGLLIVVGVLWRVEAGMLALLIAVPALLILHWELSWSLLRRRLLPIGLLAGVIAGCIWFSHSCVALSECPAWTDYAHWNGLREAFNEDPRAYALPPFIGVWGWTPGALSLFLSYAYPDNAIFGSGALEKAFDTVPGMLRMDGSSMGAHVSAQVQTLMRFWPYLLVVLGIAMFGWRRAAARRRLTVIVIAFMGWFFVIFTSVALLRLTEPLILGLVFELGIVVLGIGLLSDSRERQDLDLKERLTGVVVIVSAGVSLAYLLGLGGTSIARWVGINQAQTAASAQVSARYESIAGDSRAFSTATFPGCVGAPFLAGPFDAVDRRVKGPLASGWPVFSPAFEQRKRTLGLGDIYADIWAGAQHAGFGGDGVLFVGTEQQAQDTVGVMSFQLGYSPPLSFASLGDLCGSAAAPDSHIQVWRFFKTT